MYSERPEVVYMQQKDNGWLKRNSDSDNEKQSHLKWIMMPMNDNAELIG